MADRGFKPGRSNLPLDPVAAHRLRQFMPGRGNFFVARDTDEIEAAGPKRPTSSSSGLA
jgi:hypothetical protein